MEKRNSYHAFHLLLVVTFCLLIAAISADSGNKYPFFPHSTEDEIRIRSLVDEINGKNLTWKAEYNPLASLARNPVNEPDAVDYSSLKLDGLSIEESINIQIRQIFQDTVSHLKQLASHSIRLPSAFDAREKWSLCSSVHHIQNQGGCGSCWAAAATATISDRLCISTNFTEQKLISTQDLVSCCDFCGRCQGGNDIFPYLYWKKHGIVSGGSLGSNEGCRPYEIESTCGSPCPHYFFQTKFNPKCVRKCQPLFNGDYKSDIGRGKSIYLIRLANIYKSLPGFNKNEEVMNGLKLTPIDLVKRELFLHGPASICTHVDEPFAHYRSGIYTETKTITRTSEALSYGHCMKLLGWDEENGNEFWIVANSWGRQWGENGFGRISINYMFAHTAVTAGLW